ncbi:putative ribonuclease H-like domain-containing protein [Tanacetum coccineum]
MELENSQNNVLAKLPMLKLGEYEMWENPYQAILSNPRLTALWEYVDAQSMFPAIKARFGGNEATKRTQKALLKQQLAILGVVTPPEDLNVKFLRSLPSEWDTHVIVWMNKPDFDTMGLDDLYNNFKIVEQKVKRSTGAINDENKLGISLTIQKLESRVARSKAVRIEDAFEKAMCAIDGTGFDWSDMAEGEIQANIDLMDCSDSNDTSFKASTYKRGLSIFEGKILKYKESEVLFSEEIALLKRSVDWVSDDEDDVEPIPKVKIKLLYLLLLKKEFVKPETPAGGQLRPVNTVRSVNTGRPFSTAKSFNTVRPSYTAHPKSIVHCARPSTYFQNQAQSTVRRPFYKRTTLTQRSYNQNVNTGRQNVNTSRKNVNTVRARGFNAVKPSACWVWRPIKPNGGNHLGFFNKYNYIDARRADTKITGKGTIKTDKLDFDDVYFVKELKFNLFSVSQMCDKKNYVLFTDSEFPKDGLTCLVAKATSEESMLWHRRLGHVNFKNINKLVKENLVRDLPLKRFENDQTCVACLKGKQHRASCKTKAFNPITKPLFMLHIDLLVQPFDETSEILQNFIKEIENLVDKKVKIIRSDNGTEFKNKVMDEFCREKGIKREYSVARTPQQNGVAERKNRTLIEAARTMLADSKLPTTFWAEAVSTACYVQNRVLIVKPHNKTPYELFRGIKPAIGFMKPFGCHVTILNTLDKLGKFDGKSDEGFFVGYSLSSKAFRVYNIRTRKVQENLHIGFLENKPMIEGNGPKWLFDLDSLTQSMNYVPVVAGTFSNDFAGIQGVSESSTSSQQDQDWIAMPIWKDASYFGDASPNIVDNAQIEDKDELNDEDDATEESHNGSNIQNNDIADQQVNTARQEVNTGSREVSTALPKVNAATHEDLVGLSSASEDSHMEVQEIELGNIPQSYEVTTTPQTRIHKDHPIEHVIGDVQSSVQTRRMKTSYSEKGFLSAIYEGKYHQDLHTCLFVCFLSQEEPKRISQALRDPAWVEAMQEELLQFKMQKVWILVDLPKGHRAIGTKCVYRNKKDERGIVIKNKARLVTQGHTQEEGIDYDKVFAPVARIEEIRIFLAYASYMGFMIYQMDVKSAFLYGQIEKEKKKGIFISQDKYVHKILRKFNYSDVKSASTPTDLEKPLVQDGDAADVDEHLYRSMIGSLMYLTASRPDIMFAVCACARFQVSPKSSHLLAVKRIFRYLKGKPSLGFDRKSTTGGCSLDPKPTAGLWPSHIHPRSYPTRFLTVLFMANLDFCDKHNMAAFLEKSTGSEGFHQVINFLARSHICYALTKKLAVSVSFTKQFWRSAEASTDDNGEVKIIATIDGHSMTITEASLRRHLKLDDNDGITALPNSEIFEQLALMGYHTDSDKLTFQKGAFSPQWRFLIHNILHCLSPRRTALGEFSSIIDKLMVAVLEDDLRKTKKTYSFALTKLIRRVKKLEARVKIGKSKKRAKKASTETEPIIQEVTPTEVIQDQGSISTAEENISTAGRTVTYRRRSEEQRTRKDKGKAIMTESEPKKKSKKELEQERLSFAEAIRLEEQMNEEQRAHIARDEEIARQWDKEERQRAMSEAKSTKKIDWNDPSVIRYHALKMKPKTIAQARRNMIKYLKNQGNYKISDFKGMSYNEIRPIFEKV